MNPTISNLANHSKSNYNKTNSLNTQSTQIDSNSPLLHQPTSSDKTTTTTTTTDPTTSEIKQTTKTTTQTTKTTAETTPFDDHKDSETKESIIDRILADAPNNQEFINTITNKLLKKNKCFTTIIK